MIVALDTNVLVYAEGLERSEADGPKCARARSLVRRDPTRLILPVQVVAEFAALCRRKLRLSQDETFRRVRRWYGFPMIPTTQDVLRNALNLAETRSVSIFDAVIVAAAADAGCRYLLTEDRQSAERLLGVRLLNPFLSEHADEIESAFGA